MITVKNLKKSYITKNIEVHALKNIDLKIKKGEFLGLTGKSGAGKSTLLYQLGLLDKPTSGSIVIDNVDTYTLTDTERANLRLKFLGYVFQDYALLPDLTAVENVAIPLIMQGESYKDAKNKAKQKLTKVGLSERINNLPSELSGGEQQRVAIARALICDPKIIFADEPTANLDTENALNILNIFKDLNKAGQTIVMITHEKEYTKFASRVITLEDGLIKSV